MAEKDMIRAEVPAQLKAKLRSVLALERVTITEWLIAQMERTIQESGAHHELD